MIDPPVSLRLTVPGASASASVDWYVDLLRQVRSPQASALPEADARALAAKLFLALASKTGEVQPDRSADVANSAAGRRRPGAAASSAHREAANKTYLRAVTIPDAALLYSGTWRQSQRGKGQHGQLSDHTWRGSWGYDRPFVFSVGLWPARPGQHGGSAGESFRIAIRIQSPRPLRADLRRRIVESFDHWCDRLASVRFTSPAFLLKADPRREWEPWKGPRGPMFAIGAPVAINAGRVGALSLLTKQPLRRYAITAGHVVSHGGEGEIGTRVFCPPQSDGEISDPFGTVATLRELPRRRLLDAAAISPGQKTPDAALIRIGDARIPPVAMQRRVADAADHNARLPTQPPRSGDRVVKVAARTALARGTIRATGLYLEVQDSVTGTMHFGNNLLEIELEPGYQLLAGDSGALVYGIAEGINVPLAIVLAGVHESGLSGPESGAKRTDTRRIAYAQQLTDLDLPAGMELA